MNKYPDSTTQRSVAPSTAQKDGGVTAPNLGGDQPTSDLWDWMAGKLEGWKENDCYREFFEECKSAEGMLGYDADDKDYDDNGGVPTGEFYNVKRNKP